MRFQLKSVTDHSTEQGMMNIHGRLGDAEVTMEIDYQTGYELLSQIEGIVIRARDKLGGGEAGAMQVRS